MSPHEVQILVPGESCAGLAFSTSSTANSQVFVTDELDLKHYESVIKSNAVICQSAEATSHIVVVCRILGIPVVILERAIDLIPPNTPVTVDTQHGRICVGDGIPQPTGFDGSNVEFDKIVTENLRYQVSIIDLPDLVTRVNSIDRSDVNYFFLREEFIWVGQDINPFNLYRDQGPNGITKLLLKSLLPLAKRLEDYQLLNFRSLDLRSDQLNQFGGPITHEPNPHLGMHGIRQLLRCNEYLAAELYAVDQLYEMGFSNVVFSIPFLILESELEAVLRLREQICKNAIRLGVFVETPAAISELQYLVNHDISVVFVGTKDLAQLILAADRDNRSVADILRINSRPVIHAIRYAADLCLNKGLPIYVFTYLDELSSLRSSVPGLTGFSMPASDYLRAFRRS